VVFIESRGFTKRLLELAKDKADEVLGNIQRDLLQSPLRGSVVPGLAGIRKGRAGNPSRGKGKRGGYRYLYLFLVRKNHIHLLFLLEKDAQEDLSPPERVILRRLVAGIATLSTQD
jgi:hypothetical protein